MPFKFEKLDVWKRPLDYADAVYDLAERLPSKERFNLTDQIRWAATSVSLNIAEGSTGQTDAEQARFLGIALRSLTETVACLHLIRRRGYAEKAAVAPACRQAERLAAQIIAMRRSLRPDKPWVREEWVREESASYLADIETRSHAPLENAFEDDRRRTEDGA